jgi:hypothetical protein
VSDEIRKVIEVAVREADGRAASYLLDRGDLGQGRVRRLADGSVWLRLPGEDSAEVRVLAPAWTALRDQLDDLVDATVVNR